MEFWGGVFSSYLDAINAELRRDLTRRFWPEKSSDLWGNYTVEGSYQVRAIIVTWADELLNLEARMKQQTEEAFKQYLATGLGKALVAQAIGRVAIGETKFSVPDVAAIGKALSLGFSPEPITRAEVYCFAGLIRMRNFCIAHEQSFFEIDEADADKQLYSAHMALNEADQLMMAQVCMDAARGELFRAVNREVLDSVHKKTERLISERNRKAAHKKNEPYKEMKAYVAELDDENLEKKPSISMRQSALSIVPLLRAWCEERSLPRLSELQQNETVYRWVRDHRKMKRQ